MLKNFRKLAKIAPSEWLLLTQLILFALAAVVVLRLAGLSRLVRLMTRCAEDLGFSSFPLLHRRHDIARLTTLVEFATRVTHGQKRCLPRSLLLFWLLKARGQPASLLIGVSKMASTLESHAWIEAEEKVMGDSSKITERFIPLLRF